MTDYSDSYNFRGLLLDVSRLCVGRGDVEALLVLAEKPAESNLPSWIPELSWGACRCSKAPVKASLDYAGGELRIRGYVVDQTPEFDPGITMIGGQPRISESRLSLGDAIYFRIQFIDLFGERTILDSDDWDNVEIVWRTVTLDLGPGLPTREISKVHQTACYDEQFAAITTLVSGEDSDLGLPGDEYITVIEIHDQIWRSYQLAKYRWNGWDPRVLDLATKLHVQDILRGAVPYFHGMKLASSYCGRLVARIIRPGSNFQWLPCSVCHATDEE
ncbi:hypothetical protein BKA61DRAFT_663469 [Leptodontidium sp. MPI-SDFR-AT-0119]|nr:hypothetical protein BKA61DRAFT_663469 [Leptodontidium sp. MPI-SDFR-AT-0119]